ncbi:MAG: hypothetical protein L0216_07650 [Planctomycetales bacterium]|nr:hypothetical protein [Planctomycetales bacterium]
MQEILSAVARLRRRALLAELVRRLGLATLVAAVVLLLTLHTDRLFVLGLPLLPIAVGCGLAAAGAGLFLALRAAPDTLRTAVAADQKFALAERLSSALRAVEDPSPMAPALLADAAAHARAIRPAEVYPIRPPRGSPIFLALLAGLGLAFLLPTVDLFGIRTRQAARAEERKVVAEAVTTLKKKTDEIKRLKKPEVPDSAGMLEKTLEQVAQEIAKNAPTKRDALVKIASAQEKIREEREKLAAAAEKLKESLSGPMGLRMTQDLRRALEKADPQAAKSAMAQIKQKVDTGAFTDADLEKLSAELQKLAMRMPEDAALRQSLQRAADALARKAAEKAGQPGKEGQEGKEGKEGAQGKDGKKGEGEKGEGKQGSGEKGDEESREALRQVMQDIEGLAEAMAQMDEMDQALEALEASKYAMLPAKLRLCDLCRRGIPHEIGGG